MSDISPIADLIKTEVFALGRELGIIESILSAPPTDGLWGDDRTDEESNWSLIPRIGVGHGPLMVMQLGCQIDKMKYWLSIAN